MNQAMWPSGLGPVICIVGARPNFMKMAPILRAFGPQAHAPAKAFDDWLADTMLRSNPAERSERLLNWETAPAARIEAIASAL